ncbi:MAG: hypothetical protein ACKVQU_11720 [Burkholderiales bacterium]
MRNSVLRIACSIAVAAGVTGQASATDSRKNFDVTFKECTEFVGVGSVDGAKADALVPNRFKIASFYGIPGQSSIVVRVSHCGSIAVDGRHGKPGTVAHIGINIVAPVEGANINNYTIAYASDHQQLVAKLQNAGIPAEFDPDLMYEAPRAGVSKGRVFAAINTEHSPQWLVKGTFDGPFKPFPGAEPFVANWWRAGPNFAIKMETTIDSISFLDASEVSFFTSRHNIIGNLIGGHKIGTFDELPVRGVFGNAEMKVTVQK